jgi:protein-L-isoaspartate(D-aspartate) O-methyltransferase
MYENRMEAFAGMLARPPFTRGPFGRRARPGVGALIVLALLGSGSAVSGAAQQAPFTEAREEMVRRYIVSVHPLMEPIGDPAVIEALRAVPRHEFVPPELRDAAYLNQPLPIGHGQTISQPYIVALMTQLLELEPGDKTLEIGTGSGYQAAVLAEIVESVFTIEIIEPLATSAEVRLQRLGYDAVHRRHGDGYFGWPEHGPFDGIVVTAAATHIPPPLVEQLAVGGRMVIPVGPPFRTQQLMLLEKRADGSVTQRSIAPVAFVPFTRGEPER